MTAYTPIRPASILITNGAETYTDEGLLLRDDGDAFAVVSEFYFEKAAPENSERLFYFPPLRRLFFERISASITVLSASS
jgi:hypothetical protein